MLFKYPKNKVYCKSFLPPSLPCVSKPINSFFSYMVKKLHVQATALNSKFIIRLMKKQGPTSPITCSSNLHWSAGTYLVSDLESSQYTLA